MISRLGRKRRERRAQTQPDHPFAVESCEYLTDGAFALLRVSGSGSVAPIALVTQGDGPEAFDPLPQPGDAVVHGGWQIAFALPTDVIEPGSRVWLHDGGLYLADLLIPSPGEREAPAPVEHTPVQTSDEATVLREKLADREEELAQALKELLELRAEVERLEKELSAARAENAAAEAKRLKLEESNKSRRAGIARRSEDRAARKQVAELEKQLAEREQRIEQLEKEAESFAARRQEAVADSLREQIAALEEDARQRGATNDDLRALLESEREIVVAARREAEDLRKQLAADRAEPSEAVQQDRPRPRPVPATSKDGAQSPPWSALDDELLARIEKAKALTS